MLIISYLYYLSMAPTGLFVALGIIGFFILVTILITVKRRYSMRGGTKSPIKRGLTKEFSGQGEQAVAEVAATSTESQTQM